MKYKEFIFDVEMFITHHEEIIRGHKVEIGTHRVFRCLNMKELRELLISNQVIDGQDIKITFNIRGVNS